MKKSAWNLLPIALVIHFAGFSQTAPSVSAEFSAFLGAQNASDGIGMASLVFDTRFRPGDGGLGIRFGVGAGTDGMVFGTSNEYVVFPLSVNYLLGKNRGFLELGGGCMAVLFDRTPNGPGGSSGEISPTLTAGYRLQALNKGLTGRFFLGGAWFKGFGPRSALQPYVGFSIGYKFPGWGE